MARQVKETPVLTGSDAQKFEQRVKNNENDKVPRESYERAQRVFESVSKRSFK